MGSKDLELNASVDWLKAGGEMQLREAHLREEIQLNGRFSPKSITDRCPIVLNKVERRVHCTEQPGTDLWYQVVINQKVAHTTALPVHE